MITSIRYLKGVLNADGSFFKILPDEHINSVNMRIGSAPSANSSTDDWESIGSTISIATPLGAGQNYGIGGCWDETANRLILCIWNVNGFNRILCWDLDATVMYEVLLDADVTGGLGWDKNQLIHSCFVINGCFYWTDNVMPRRIDIDAGIKTYQPGYVTTKAPYTQPLAQSVIAWIRRPPGLPLVQNKVTQTSPVVVNNFIRYEAIQFMARYKFRNFELSTLSAHSTTANYNADDDTFNRIDVSLSLLEHIEQDVIQVDFVAFYFNTNKAFIIRSWMTSVAADAAAIAAHNAGTAALSYPFYNNLLGTALDDAYVVKPFDSVPITAGTVTTAKNRTFQGKVKQGYNTPTTVSSLVATPVVTGGTANGEILVEDAVTIIAVKIGGSDVVYISGVPLPIVNLGLGFYATTSVGTSETVVVSITGPGGGGSNHVILQYGPGDNTFTAVSQLYTGSGDYTFTGIPIAASPNITWAISVFNT